MQTARQTETARPARVRVWDLFIRGFHWSLVTCVTVAAVTGFLLGPSWTPLHLIAGFLALALVGARILWGLCGPTHARFASFVRGPGPVLAHLRAVLKNTHERRYLGHNPLGALMVVALILAILALGWTGLEVWGGMIKAGPFAFDTSFATGLFYRHVHQALAIAVLVLIALHLGGVILESRREKESLVAAMIDGEKPARPNDVALPERRARPRPALILGAALAVLAGSAGFGFSSLPVPDLPVTPAHFDPAYASECSDCHEAYNPTLLPAASWQHLMATLDDHFGEDASLDPATTQRIGTWLQAHAAESADTLAAHVMRRVSAEHPDQITATRFWKWMHGNIPEETFKSAAVGSRGHCSACHADAAAGLFRPASISVPEEAEN